MNIIKVATAGSVDDGKSTLIARLLLDSNSLPEDLKPKDDSPNSLANLLDGLDLEREQGITIDVAHRFFNFDSQRFHIMDSPGHEQYTRNMATAASGAHALLLLISANEGIKPQTIKHYQVAQLVGVREFIVIINKLDLIKSPEKRFKEIKNDFLQHVDTSQTAIEFVGVVALTGENVVKPSKRISYEGSRSLLAALKDVGGRFRDSRQVREHEASLISVQAIIRGTKRIYLGEIFSGKIEIGDLLNVAGQSTQAQIQELLVSGSSADKAFVGDQISFSLDRDVDLARGDILSKQKHSKETAFVANLVWLDNSPGLLKRRYLIQVGHQKVPVRITKIKSLELERQASRPTGATLPTNSISRVELFCSIPIAISEDRSTKLAKFILIDAGTGNSLAAGTIVHALRKSQNVIPHDFESNSKSVAARLGFVGKVVWLTGLSGSGKSTIANAVAAELDKRDLLFSILDGDSLRLGINKDLGFTDSDRVENIRRTAEIAKIQAEAGLITIVALVSPFRDDREDAREIIGPGNFLEVYVSTPIEECEKRDPKGLYKKARAGLIPNFTGIDSRYEAPIAPDLEVDSAEVSLESAAGKVIDLVLGALE
jgi:bifunctional enzyme CysN/CysC